MSTSGSISLTTPLLHSEASDSASSVTSASLPTSQLTRLFQQHNYGSISSSTPGTATMSMTPTISTQFFQRADVQQHVKKTTNPTNAKIVSKTEDVDLKKEREQKSKLASQSTFHPDQESIDKAAAQQKLDEAMNICFGDMSDEEQLENIASIRVYAFQQNKFTTDQIFNTLLDWIMRYKGDSNTFELAMLCAQKSQVSVPKLMDKLQSLNVITLLENSKWSWKK